MRLSRPPVDARWLEAELVELERLVESGVAADVVAALDRIVGRPRRLAESPVSAGESLR
jgi:hypothetical protein